MGLKLRPVTAVTFSGDTGDSTRVTYQEVLHLLAA
jgi:hypothetical protein